ncbi:hypothetical protein BG07_5797 (plasmid) [Bacillus pseudomycoides]|nr:hypothetical protein DJ92_5810 [Bacillus pseudomycoides]AJI14591.1 hypothetical protein BG07_5797 [Bacillus pseudomycoides]
MDKKESARSTLVFYISMIIDSKQMNGYCTHPITFPNV